MTFNGLHKSQILLPWRACIEEATRIMVYQKFVLKLDSDQTRCLQGTLENQMNSTVMILIGNDTSLPKLHAYYFACVTRRFDQGRLWEHGHVKRQKDQWRTDGASIYEELRGKMPNEIAKR